MPRVPNLTQDLYRAGSRVVASVPNLTKCEITRTGKFDLEWEAEGTKTYEVTASGYLDSAEPASKRWKGMSVHCTCRSLEEMDLRTEESGWRILYVCKHLKAALDSVCEDNDDDEEAEDSDSEEQEEEEKETGTAESQNEANERERLEEEVFSQSDRTIAESLRQRMSTEEGIKALSVLFPPKQQHGRKRRREDGDEEVS